jgi:hypothetical protein
MTPLAFALLKDLTTPGAFRTVYGDERRFAWKVVNEFKCFSVVAAQDLVFQQATRMEDAFTKSRDRLSSRLAFLPATSTWLEFSGYALLLRSDETCIDDCLLWQVLRDDGVWHFRDLLFSRRLPLIGSGPKPCLDGIASAVKEHGDPRIYLSFWLAYAALAIINSPRIIGQRQHMPHERVEREKLKALGLVGKFPLRAWTEIVLKVALPDDKSGEPSKEAHLTGEKCLHYCRTHLRWCEGRLEYLPVEGHWRGNPALGIKRSRYRVES